MYEENMMMVTKSDLSAENSNQETQNSNGDLIYRDDALKPFCVAPDGTRIPEVDCDNLPVEFSVEFIKKHLLSIPSAESRGDLMSREDAIEAIEKNKSDWDNDYNRPIDKCICTLTTLPSADAKTKCIAQIKVDTEEIVRRIKEEYDITDGWIPVSERLPSEDGYYLVTWKDDDGRCTLCDYYSKWLGLFEQEVVAWQPLPTPYREENEE